MSKKQPEKKYLDFIGLLLILPPLLVQTGWITLDFPYINLLLLVLSIAAVLFCVKGFNQPTISFRILSILVVIAGTLLAFINLFKLI